ncbi:hypothetical protein F5Y19DRAFT_145241 [Xylariaceae sp. FL1651]|nr:hypothetical protein F5Y19DRAFT_145241 [Xylariaceae sp. FL1651]
MDLPTVRPAASVQESAVVFSRANVSLPSRKVRSACNRCHLQKLRCVKLKEHASCERCTRLKTECRFSPRGSQRQSLGTAPGVRPEPGPRCLRPVLAAATPNARQDSTAIPGVTNNNWLDSPHADMDTADRLGSLYPGSAYATQSIVHSMQDTFSHWPNDYTEFINVNLLDHGETADLGLSFVDHNVTSRESKNSSPTPSHMRRENQSNQSRSYGFATASTAGKLACLNIALYECANKLPSINILAPRPAGVVPVPNGAGNGARKAALFAIDELFRVTNEFIDITKCLSSVVDRHKTTSNTIIPSLVHSVQEVSTTTSPHIAPLLPGHHPHPSHTTQLQPEVIEARDETEVPSLPPRPFSHLDEATMLMFLSCHCRLTEIYESIFLAIRRCIEGSYAASHPGAGIILPELTVGGHGGVTSPAMRVDFHAPPLPSATISMYMVLVTTLSSQLWARVREAIGSGVGSNSSPSSDHEKQAPTACSGLADPMWDIAMTRTDDMTQTIEAVQQMLQQ